MSFFCLLTDISVAWENCSFPTKTGRYNRPGDRERKGWKWDGWIKVCRMVSSTDHSITQIKITYKLVWNTCRYYTEDDGQKTLNSLYEEWFHCEDLGTQLGPIIKRYATESCYMQYIGSNATFESSKSGFLYFQFVELCGHLQIFFLHILKGHYRINITISSPDTFYTLLPFQIFCFGAVQDRQTFARWEAYRGCWYMYLN